MREAFDAELRGLLEKIMQMGGIAERMIARAVRGVFEPDGAALAEVLRDEDQVNRLQLAIDEQAVAITVRHQPVARDVRLVFGASRCATDVERIADQAVNIAQSARYVHAAPGGPTPPAALAEMAELARRLLADALAAVVTRDVRLAEQVLAGEPRVDALRDAVFRELLGGMIADPLGSRAALSLILISRNLERVGDHATNIAEEVVYLVRGRDIRHREGPSGHGPARPDVPGGKAEA